VRAYVAELLGRLRVGGRERRRIAAEVTDHLAELVDEERRNGAEPEVAAERAVARFGSPAELAAEFNQDAARHSLTRAAWALVGCVAMAAAAAGIALQGAVPARPWPSDLVFYTASELMVQIAAVCGLNGLLLAVVAPWLRGVPLTGRPALLAGRSLAAASVVLIPMAVVAVGNLGGGVPAAERLPLAALAVGVPIAAYRGLRAVFRASWLGPGRDGENVLDVIADLGARLAGRWALTGRAYRLAGRAWRTARDRAPWLMGWIDLRRHPWRTAVTVSIASGLALKAPDLLIGDPDLIAAGMEAVAVFLSFTALGGLLGLRGSRSPATPEPDRLDLVTG
jgi:hypothetical protein